MGCYSQALQNAIEAVNATRQTIAQLEGQQKAYERKLETHRKNYKILIDNEPIVVKMLQVGIASDNIFNALEVSIKNIQNIGSKYQLPGFSELLRFDDTTHAASVARTKNEDVNEYIKGIASKIDSLMTETANKITDAKNNIDDLKYRINSNKELLFQEEQVKQYYEELQRMESMGGY